MAGKIKRNVYFYQLELSLKGTSVPVRDVLNHINTLPYTDQDNGRYYPIADDNMRSLMINSLDSPYKAIVGTKRNNGLPVQESQGDMVPLELRPGYGLYEPAHFMIFPDNILAMEYNHHDPRALGLRNYLLRKCRGVVDKVEIEYVWQPNILRLLNKVNGIKALEIKLPHYDESTFDDGDTEKSFSGALRAFQHLEPKYVNLTLGSDVKSGGLNVGKKELVKMISRPEIVDGIKSLKVTPIDGAEFDLISPYLISATRVTKQDATHRTVDTESMFEEIEKAYKDSKSLIDEFKKSMMS